jgi:hypothetical protein
MPRAWGAQTDHFALPHKAQSGRLLTEVLCLRLK